MRGRGWLFSFRGFLRVLGFRVQGSGFRVLLDGFEGVQAGRWRHAVGVEIAVLAE
jgi:hypothetical protein